MTWASKRGATRRPGYRAAQCRHDDKTSAMAADQNPPKGRLELIRRLARRRAGRSPSRQVAPPGGARAVAVAGFRLQHLVAGNGAGWRRFERLTSLREGLAPGATEGGRRMSNRLSGSLQSGLLVMMLTLVAATGRTESPEQVAEVAPRFRCSRIVCLAGRFARRATGCFGPPTASITTCGIRQVWSFCLKAARPCNAGAVWFGC
uniref:Uncharacterized protein n=1 Tax=Aplysina aerophoba bacterial symbiont clone pAE27P20 TaxID=377636 RepID=A4U8P4_9BACT|nr:hypothetical protein [Aplysina aerophoba bacterial symbiont clone pAE27P20]